MLAECRALNKTVWLSKHKSTQFSYVLQVPCICYWRLFDILCITQIAI
jgi:hypothetical protein